MCDLPPEAYEDCFHPPSIPTQVFCLHCQEIYDSYLIEWREENTPHGMRGFWRCPTPGCSGAGFGFDIHPVDPDYIDPDGREMAQWDEDEGEAWDDDAAAELDEIDELDELDLDELTAAEMEAERPFAASDVEPALTGPEDEHDPFAIPMDDLLPENESVGSGHLTLEEMDEIERKIGWRTDHRGAATDSSGSSSHRRDGERLDEDDIPF